MELFSILLCFCDPGVSKCDCCKYLRVELVLNYCQNQSHGQLSNCSSIMLSNHSIIIADTVARQAWYNLVINGKLKGELITVLHRSFHKWTLSNSINSSLYLEFCLYHFFFSTWYRREFLSGETLMSSGQATGYVLLFLTRTHCAVLLLCYVQAGKGFLYRTHLHFCSEVRDWCYS